MRTGNKLIRILGAVLPIVLAPVTVYLSMRFLSGSRSFYIPSLLLILLSLLPFFTAFERRRLKTGELVVIASAVAAAVAGRAVMSFIPQLKPTCAVVVMTGAAFGGHVGFITGSLAMLISNFIFGQGVFTPFQMLGMGLVGFFSGLIFCGKPYANRRIPVSLTGALLTFAVYGAVVDSCSVLTMATDAVSVRSILASGAVFNLIHAANTALILFFLQKPVYDKFSRLRTKYGVFDQQPTLLSRKGDRT